jgi:uncharacterized protein YjbI with pentapeptide repeats
MANMKHLARLNQTAFAWNSWRKKNSEFIVDLSTAALVGAVLTRKNLSKSNLRGSDLRYADLSGAVMHHAELQNANMSNAFISGTDLSGACLRGANLESSNLSGSDLSGADLNKAYLRNANLQRASLNGASLSDAHLQGANLSGTDLRRADLRNADLSGVLLLKIDLRGIDLSGVHLRGANLSGTDLQDACLNGADLSGANLQDTNLRSASLKNARLQRTNLRGANLNDANLAGTNLCNTNLTQATLRRANLCRVNLTGKDLSGLDLAEANLTLAHLESTTLQNTVLDQANLSEAYLWETQRAGWSIKGIICERAYWGKHEEKPSEYQPGEFEKLYSDQTCIELFYEGGISTFELNTLPALLQRLASMHPEAHIRLRTIEETGGGAKITISLGNANAETKEKIEADAMQVVRAQLRLREDEVHRLQIEQRYLEDYVPKLMRELLNLGIPQITFNAPVHTAAVASGNAKVELQQTFNSSPEILQLINKLLAHNTELTASQSSKVEKAKTELQKPSPDKSLLSRTLGFLKTLPKEAILKGAGKLGEKAAEADWSSLLNYLHHLG